MLFQVNLHAKIAIARLLTVPLKALSVETDNIQLWFLLMQKLNSSTG